VSVHFANVTTDAGETFVDYKPVYLTGTFATIPEPSEIGLLSAILLAAISCLRLRQN
jgi:hypothetical protein